jgi:hypothetical protein
MVYVASFGPTDIEAVISFLENTSDLEGEIIVLLSNVLNGDFVVVHTIV